MADPPILKRAIDALPSPAARAVARATKAASDGWSIAAAAAASAGRAEAATSTWWTWVAWGAVVVLAAQALSAVALAATIERARGCAGSLEALPKYRPDGLVLAYELGWDVPGSAALTVPGSQWFALALEPGSDAASISSVVKSNRVNAAILGGSPVLLRATSGGRNDARVVLEARYAAVQGRVTMPVPCSDKSGKSRPHEFDDGGLGVRVLSLLAFDHGGQFQ